MRVIQNRLTPVMPCGTADPLDPEQRTGNHDRGNDREENSVRHLQQQLLDQVMIERRRLSRRHLLGGSLKVAGGAAVALALAGTPSPVSIRQWAAAQEMVSDLDVLNYALTLEHLEYAFYRDGVGLFTFGNDSRGASVDANLATIRDHEEAHVVTLTQVIIDLGGEPVAEGAYTFGDAYSDPVEFLATAMALENTGVSAYDGAAQFLTDGDLLTAAGSIVAVEARHASYLNLINGEIPFPAAFETPLSMEDVLEIAGPFLAG